MPKNSHPSIATVSRSGSISVPSRKMVMAGGLMLATAVTARFGRTQLNYCLGLALTRSGRPQEAIQYYQEVLQLIPRSALVHNDLGIALAMTGRNAEAIEQFQQALQLSPGDAKAHNNFGLALLQLKQSEKAVSEFEHALKPSPDDPQTYANLAQAYADSSCPDQSASRDAPSKDRANHSSP